MFKQCFKCKETKSLSEFYVHGDMADGHLGKCKTCTKRDTSDRASRLMMDPKWVEGERARWRKKQAVYRGNNPLKCAAHYAARKAEVSGVLVRPDSCQRCGEVVAKLEKHHHDYSKPLEVEWMCRKCHELIHEKQNPTTIKRYT